MTNSSSTLIQTVNTVLENIGERRQLNLTSPVSRKCVQAIKDVLADISSLDDWEFTRSATVAVSWLADTAFVGDVVRVHRVIYGDTTTGFVTIPWVDSEQYDTTPTLPGIRATVYTTAGYNTIRLKPYPVTADEQSKYVFRVSRNIVMPSLEDETFGIPERLMSLVVYKTCSLMCLSHLDDQQAADRWERLFSNLVLQTRAREASIPAGGISTFKLRGRRKW